MKKQISIMLLLFIIITVSIISMHKSYSADFSIEITGTPGNRILNYYDAITKYKYSIDTLVEYYDMSEYMEIKDANTAIYFYRGKEIDESSYKIGYSKEQADKRAKEYGPSGYRVTSTEEALNALKSIFNNQKYGIYMLEFSKYESINWNEVKEYYDNHYGLTNPYQNYYNYNQKGNQEPDRFGLDISNIDSEELKITATNIRITKDELQVVEAFSQELLKILNKGSDYEKIAATYEYITKTTNYYNDPGYINDNLSSTASVYDALIKRQSACVGYSIAFSYLMDKLGIESYIVDSIAKIDINAQYFQSVHTYNIVKLDNKFYKVDTTGGILLGALSENELTPNNLPISSEPYQVLSNPTIDYNAINNYLNSAKTTKTTTTKSIFNTSTKRQTKQFNIPTNYPANKNTTNTNQTAIKEEPTRIIEENGTTRVIIDITTNTIQENETKKNKLNLNYILIPILILVILLYIIYKIMIKKKGNNTHE